MERSYMNGDNDLHFSLFGFGIGRRKTCSLVNSPLDIRIRVHIFKALSLKHHIPITFALTKAPLTFLHNLHPLLHSHTYLQSP